MNSSINPQKHRKYVEKLRKSRLLPSISNSCSSQSTLPTSQLIESTDNLAKKINSKGNIIAVKDEINQVSNVLFPQIQNKLQPASQSQFGSQKVIQISRLQMSHRKVGSEKLIALPSIVKTKEIDYSDISDISDEDEGESVVWDNKNLKEKKIREKMDNKDLLTQWAIIYKFRYETYPGESKKLSNSQFIKILNTFGKLSKKVQTKYFKNSKLKLDEIEDFIVEEQ